MKTYTTPASDDSGNEMHPAFGVIGVHRTSATPGAVLFQSDLRHSQYIRITVHEAARKRNLSQDWVHPGKMVCEVSLSLSQFASFVSSGGTEGVPCTIEFTGSGDHEPGSRPGLLPASRLSLTHDEVRAAAGRAYEDIQDALRKYEATLGSLAGKGSAAARRAAMSRLRAAVANAAPNVEYAAKALNEHAEEVVEKSRADIEAMAAQAAERLGIPAIEVQAIEAAASTDQGPPAYACECYCDCRDCSLSGEWHVHPGKPCPVHPDAPGDR
jgi:hypothetical protein